LASIVILVSPPDAMPGTGGPPALDDVIFIV
jgi:hypothetical protein